MNAALFLKENSLKVTPHRVTVLEFLSKKHVPRSVKDIFTALKKTGIDQVTVYRVMRSFVDASLVKQIDLGDDQAYFEIIDTEHDHHHIICKNCKKVSDFVGCNADALIKNALKQTKDFTSVIHHSFDLFGVCVTCSKK